ncbi:transmembrane protein [Ceratobasidium sp. AG-Ba]|nr:transmembrane protein [Ceratobasidium sp. AG-Ba]QRW04807.1 transmembrane protein [Ceratobasidium sp. AG-Ba]
MNASEHPTELQHPLWCKEGLGPGDHELVIRHEGVHGHPIALDFLRIRYNESSLPSVSGPAASIVPSDALLVDNTEVGMIDYLPTSSWDLTTYGGMPFNNTLHSSKQPGATIIFKFNGTAVWYFSDRNADHGKMHITLDGMVGTTILGFSKHHLNQRLLWSATELVDREHTVVIKHVDVEDKVMALDFFQYLPSRPPAIPSAHTITSTIILPGPPTESVQPLPVNPVNNPSLSIQAIVGGILGGIALLGLLAFMHVRYYRLGRNRLDSMEEYKPDYTVSPYGYGSPYIIIDSSSSAVFSVFLSLCRNLPTRRHSPPYVVVLSSLASRDISILNDTNNWQPGISSSGKVKISKYIE